MTALAAALQERGIGPGDRVAAVLPTAGASGEAEWLPEVVADAGEHMICSPTRVSGDCGSISTGFGAKLAMRNNRRIGCAASSFDGRVLRA